MDGVARLLAIEAIRTLKARYFRLLDGRDFAGMADVFCSDARFDCSEGSLLTGLDGAPTGGGGPVVEGRAAIVAWIEASLEGVPTVHHGHAHEVTIDGDAEAHGVIAMEDYLLSPDRRMILLHAAGHYHERYRIEDGAWRIAATKLVRLFRQTREDGKW